MKKTSLNDTAIKKSRPRQQKCCPPTSSLNSKVIKKSITQTRKDIADWNYARNLAQLAQDPKFFRLQDIYDAIAIDALLSSQINNRHERTLATPYELVDNDGTVEPESEPEGTDH